VGVHNSCQLDSLRESLPATAFHTVRRTQPAHLFAAYQSGASRRARAGVTDDRSGRAEYPDAKPNARAIAHRPAVADRGPHGSPNSDPHGSPNSSPHGSSDGCPNRGSDGNSNAGSRRARLGSGATAHTTVERSR